MVWLEWAVLLAIPSLRVSLVCFIGNGICVRSTANKNAISSRAHTGKRCMFGMLSCHIATTPGEAEGRRPKRDQKTRQNHKESENITLFAFRDPLSRHLQGGVRRHTPKDPMLHKARCWFGSTSGFLVCSGSSIAPQEGHCLGCCFFIQDNFPIEEQKLRTLRIGADPEKIDIVNLGSGLKREFADLCVLLVF